ncbi:PQQ-binding-like beta-propeller repeat protein [uncultured Draconibacterium sp.]|uniref:outer membrane protein assembly factor BamB family protein n=1 Tax=uncultured Draconibacterium sp. TaxID=1573823 RepID=UPI0025E61C09|nr:PQQ-binding-like beta-propeller repeat protein [uncultured Draconibacterium sp.]
MIKKCLLVAFTLLFTTTILFAQKPTVWRGENNGIYPDTGLLKEWPANGPEILWTFEGLGEGHSSPVFANNQIYLSTLQGEDGFIVVFNQDGTVAWKVNYGKDFKDSYPGSRSSVVVAGDLMYMYTGYGELICMDAKNGDKKWTKNAFEDFDGENIRWGVTETVVVDGDVVYVTPGGAKNNVVALNRFTGELIWSSPGKGETSAYCTPLLLELPARKLLVTHTADHIIALDAKTGEMLWDFPHTNRWKVHPNTPLFYNGDLFCFSGYGKGGVKLDLSDDGSSVSKQWEKVELDSRMGGMVVLDGYMYGSGDKAREWRCVNWETGEEAYVSDAIGKGVTIFADGMLYCYSDRGELALVEATPEAFKVVSQTKVELGTAQHWAHPVINKGRLFVRHGDVLIAYKIQ